MAQSDIGLIGLAVMGQNLVLNMERNGFEVAVYNRTSAKTSDFVGGPAQGKHVQATFSLAELVATVKRPRIIMLMVQAGKAVDAVIGQLKPLPRCRRSDHRRRQFVLRRYRAPLPGAGSGWPALSRRWRLGRGRGGLMGT